MRKVHVIFGFIAVGLMLTAFNAVALRVWQQPAPPTPEQMAAAAERIRRPDWGRRPAPPKLTREEPDKPKGDPGRSAAGDWDERHRDKTDSEKNAGAKLTAAPKDTRSGFEIRRDGN